MSTARSLSTARSRCGRAAVGVPLTVSTLQGKKMPHSTIQILDLAKQNAGGSDYKVAQRLAITRGAVSSWRTGRTSIDDRFCAKIAELAGLDPCYVLACVNAERAGSRDVKKQFRRLAQLAATASALSLLVFAPVISAGQGTAPDDIYYVKSQISAVSGLTRDHVFRRRHRPPAPFS